MNRRPRSLEELEQRAGIKRTVPVTPTQRDVTNLTVRRLRGPFWKHLKRR